MPTATSTASTASAPRKTLPKVSLRLSFAAGSALIPSALLCGVSKSSLGCQQVLRHLSRSLLSCEHSVCGLPLDLRKISSSICLPDQCSSELCAGEPLTSTLISSTLTFLCFISHAQRLRNHCLSG